MKNALKNEEFVLYLQPKYELQRNSIAGAEVLVRWITADGRMISPGEFIPVFERNGFILKLDQYVWEKTCQLLAGWRDEGRKIFPVSVNISRVSLYNPKNCGCDLWTDRKIQYSTGMAAVRTDRECIYRKPKSNQRDDGTASEKRFFYFDGRFWKWLFLAECTKRYCG